MNNFKLLIPTAGLATRLGIDYPKTLIEIKNESILIRIFNIFKKYDDNPIVIVRNISKDMIKNHLGISKKKAELIVQEKPNGMGDAVLHYLNSNISNYNQDIILVWGDIPLLQKKTIEKTIKNHISNNNDFTFPTMEVENPYTLVIRSKDNEILEVLESRDKNDFKHKRGERDVGLFVFKRKVFDYLKKNLDGKYNKQTGEHGFLYIIKHLVKDGLRVKGLQIATFEDTISINNKSDLEIAKKYFL